MKIGDHIIGPGAFLAPMAGITNPPFRKLCLELGAALTVTELISSHALLHLFRSSRSRSSGLRNKTLSLIEKFEGECPFAIQLFGKDPQQMAEAARLVASQGADIIDLNFGCPARKVVKGGQGAGAALLQKPDLLQKIAHSVAKAVTLPVTAKIRLGWSKSERNAPEIAERLQDAGIAAITIHARYRDQVHSGPVDLVTLAETVDRVDIPIIGNGGIRSLKEAREMLQATGCARVAVGQGAKGNPWIFRELLGETEPPTLAERIETCRRHFLLYMKWAGERRAALEMRKHACWYLKGFKGAGEMRRRLMEATGSEEFLNLLNQVAPLSAEV